MTIEDVFSITGRGTVATGKVATGVVRVGDRVTLQTAAGTRSVVVAGVEAFRRTLDHASAGETVGILLNVSRGDVAKGDTLSNP